MAAKTVLAVDLGAESGRVMAVHYDGHSLQLEELHRFPNTTVTIRGTLYWNFLRLWENIQTGIDKGKSSNPASIGVDTWGIDFGLLDKQGDLIGNPVHYRDNRTEEMMAATFAKVSKEEVFNQTGIQFMPINTLYQMVSLVEGQSPHLHIADTFLTAPDLLNYWLTGVKVCEFSNATTTQMFNPLTRNWATPMLEILDIPTHIFPEVVPPGTRLGNYAGIPVIAPACHDTASAVAAMPTQSENFAYISSGTWSLVGLEVQHPIINEAALLANVTNEGGVYNTYRLLKNVMGLWILHQCRQTWAAQGKKYSYDELVSLAQKVPPHQAIIDPDDDRFLPPGNHPQKIKDYCAETGQTVPTNTGSIVRIVLESLALKYRFVLDILRDLSKQPVDLLYIGGGGARNQLLNQLTANATGIPVVAGPIEATVIGNALVQIISLGEISDILQARQIVANMDEIKQYEPEEAALWNAAYERYKGIVS
ncbi:MAG: rhamnulokinase [Anaerolineales bacterium]|nr:rhamnulokinase [Anaerolineales bacterium]